MVTIFYLLGLIIGGWWFTWKGLVICVLIDVLLEELDRSEELLE